MRLLDIGFLRKTLSVTSWILIAAVLVFALLWVLNPSGQIEPVLALCTTLIIPIQSFREYLKNRKLRVFLSVGATYTKQQEQFVQAFESLLLESNCERLVVGRDNPPAKQPILEVRDLMRKADAVVVIAFTRIIVKKGVEKPDATNSADTRKFEDRRYPTIWNQIEAGIAFGLNRPLFIVIEDGVYTEAMLKDRFEYKTVQTTLDANCLRSEEFRKPFEKFLVSARSKNWFL